MLYTPNMTRLLSQTDPKAPTPPGFKGELFDPQKTLLHAMIELESNPNIRVNDEKRHMYHPEIQTNVCRISEKFSFGKTVLALALICSRPATERGIVPSQSENRPVEVLPTLGFHNILGLTTMSQVKSRPIEYRSTFRTVVPNITVTYNRVLPVTAVIAATNIITQWESETVRFTDLKFFTIDNVHSLRGFEEKYRQTALSGLDIIFVKAGRVTSSFKAKGELADAKRDHNQRTPHSKNRALFGAIARVLEGVPVSRLIIDDYDTLKLSGDDCLIPSLFTWIISATNRQTSIRYANAAKCEKTVEEFFRENLTVNFPVLGLSQDCIVNSMFSIRCTPQYVDEYLNSTQVAYRHILVKGGQTANILRTLDIPEEVIEMINSDAFATAAQTLGIEASTANDVIRRVVGKHIGKIVQANMILSRINAVAIPTSPLAELTDIKLAMNTVKTGTDDEFKLLIDTYNISDIIVHLREWAAEQLNTYGKSLDRMRDNLREGECQCCMLPFDRDNQSEAAYIMSGCCQIIVCESCIVFRGVTPATYIKRCPNCAQDIVIKTGLIRVSTCIDLDVNPTEEEKQAEQPPAEFSQVPNPKLQALIQLVTQILNDSKVIINCIHDRETPPFISGLLAGVKNIPLQAEHDKKLLIFTMYPESTRLIGLTLEKFNIPFCVLRGARAKKDEAVRMLMTTVNIILVTSPQDCGGLHLPILSHIIFYHKVVDPNVEAQVAARGQRLGRQCNMSIIAIHNESEYSRR
jgi:hypothetical protein